MRSLRPFSVSIPAFGLLLIFLWFVFAGVDYDGTQSFGSFTTGGWFVLGSPIVVVFSLAFAAAAARLSGKRSWFAGFALMTAVVAMTGALIWYSLPAQRVSSILGSDLAEDVVIHRLRVVDSFNEGTTTYSVISGRDGLFDSIVHRKSLKPVSSAMPMQLKMLLGEPEREAETDTVTDTAFRGEGCEFYRDTRSGRIFFWSK